MYILLKPLFSRHKGIGVQFTDEPTGSLDSVNKEVVFKILKKMQSQGKTIVIVSHDEELVERADRIINI